MFQNMQFGPPSGFTNLQMPGIGNSSIQAAGITQSSIQSQSFLNGLESTHIHAETGLGAFESSRIAQESQAAVQSGLNATYIQPSLGQTFTLANVTHEALLQSGNTAYMRLYTSHISMQAKYEALQSMYDSMLTTRLPTSDQYASFGNGMSSLRPSNPFSIPQEGMALITLQPNRKDYPRVRYWSTKDWKEDGSDAMVVNELPAIKGKTRVTKGINVTGRYIEEVDGTVVNGHQISDMRYLAMQVFNQLLKHNAAPPKFKSIPRGAFQFFLYEMYTNFPMLRLCEGHWKAIRLGSSTYSGWYRNHVSEHEGKAVKAEETTQESSAVPKKRPALTVSTQALKKSRPAPAPLPTPVRSPTPDGLEYANEPLPENLLDPVPPPVSPPTPISLSPATTPVNLPTPISLPMSPKASSNVLGVTNPLDDVFGMPADGGFRDITINQGPSSSKGKKKAAVGEEKDGPIYPTKSTSARNLFLKDYKAKHPKVTKLEFNAVWEKLPLEDPETIARYTQMSNGRKQSAKNAKNTASEST